MTRFSGLAVAVGFLVGPLVFLLLLQSSAAAPEGLDPGEFDAVVVPVSATPGGRPTPVLVNLFWQPGPQAIAPDWHGLVTRVLVRAGDYVQSGDVVLTIDGIDRIAVATPEPPYRTLTVSAAGADVAALQAFLADEGLFRGDVNGIFGLDTGDAVRSLQAMLGVHEPTSVFQPDHFVWLPQNMLRVYASDLVVGLQAPPVGSPVFVAPPVLNAAVLTNAGGEPVETAQYSDGLILEVRGQEILLWDVGTILGKALASIGSVADPFESVIDAKLKPTMSKDVLAVPASAIVTDDGVSFCVWVVEGETFALHSVRLAPEAIGAVIVEDGITAGDLVLANPREALDVSAEGNACS